MKIDTATLATQPFLKGMPAWQLELLIDDAMAAEFQEDELIFFEGGPANRFYLILSGEVAVESPGEERDDGRKPVLIETIGTGSVLGWSWLFPPYHWHFNARAITPVKAIFFYGTRLRERCDGDHELGYELMKRMTAIIIERLQATRRRLSEQAIHLDLPA